MKRALSTAAIAALSLLVFLFVGYAQEGTPTSVAELLDQELAAMESAFGSLEAFMAELIGEVKGNMGDVDGLEAKTDELRDMVTAIAIELKMAEGRIVGLRDDVNALGGTQQELKVRIVALEAGLSELSTFVDQLSARLMGTDTELGMLREEFDALIADYDVFKEAFATFQVSVYGQLGALEDSFTADISLLSITVDDLSLRVQSLEDEDVGTFKKKVIDLERSIAALAIRIDNNRAKMEGFDHAIAGLSDEMMATRESVIAANQEILAEYDLRLLALESADTQSQIDTLYFISIVALLAGVGALIWGFLGNT